MSLVLQCQRCLGLSVADVLPEVGRHVLCPHCGNKREYSDDILIGRLDSDDSVHVFSEAEKDALIRECRGESFSGSTVKEGVLCWTSQDPAPKVSQEYESQEQASDIPMVETLSTSDCSMPCKDGVSGRLSNIGSDIITDSRLGLAAVSSVAEGVPAEESVLNVQVHEVSMQEPGPSSKLAGSARCEDVAPDESSDVCVEHHVGVLYDVVDGGISEDGGIPPSEMTVTNGEVHSQNSPNVVERYCTPEGRVPSEVKVLGLPKELLSPPLEERIPSLPVDLLHPRSIQPARFPTQLLEGE